MTRAPSTADTKRLYDQASLLARIGAWECDLETEQLTWTDGVYDLFGIARGSVLHRPSIVDLYHDDARAQMECARAAAIRDGGGFTLDCEIRTSDGEDRWMRLTAQVVLEAGRPARIYGAKQDITHEKAMWTSLRRLADSDPLTGLANRRAFDRLLHDLHRRESDGAAMTTLAIVDLDYFKQINDVFGHAAGDECLRQVALRLELALSGAVLIARIGGDEFAALLRAPDGWTLRRMLARARDIVARPVSWNGRAIEIGVSIGAAMLRRSQPYDPARIFAEADSALYVAKAAGRNRHQIFGEAIEDRIGPQALRGLAGEMRRRAG